MTALLRIAYRAYQDAETEYRVKRNTDEGRELGKVADAAWLTTCQLARDLDPAFLSAPDKIGWIENKLADKRWLAEHPQEEKVST